MNFNSYVETYISLLRTLLCILVVIGKRKRKIYPNSLLHSCWLLEFYNKIHVFLKKGTKMFYTVMILRTDNPHYKFSITIFLRKVSNLKVSCRNLFQFLVKLKGDILKSLRSFFYNIGFYNIILHGPSKIYPMLIYKS